MAAAFFLPATVLAGTGEAETSAIGLTTHLALLVGGVLCLAFSLRIYLLLKGGELATGWQMFAASFLTFSLAELLSVSAAVEIMALQINTIRVLQVLALFLILLGVVKIKRSLS
jgi:hypothetical protein